MSALRLSGLGALLALLTGLASSVQAQTVVRYVHTDALGSPVAVTDQNRNVIERFEYEPYGKGIFGGPGTTAPKDGPGYTGHVLDAATGMNYMQDRYYDSGIGRFLSVDPVTAYGGDWRHFNRYAYAYNNPYKFVDPDGRSGVAALGGIIVESWNAINGRGFDGASVAGALSDGYNGEGDGFAAAAFEDASALAVVAGGVGALREAGALAVQTGEKVVAGLAKNALKDDVKGGVRQIVKSGGEKQMRQDAAGAMKGAKVGEQQTAKGVVQTAKHADGTTVSARSFSSNGRPSIQVNIPKTEPVIKVRYEK